MSLQLRVQIVKRLNTNYKEPDPLDKKIVFYRIKYKIITQWHICCYEVLAVFQSLFTLSVLDFVSRFLRF